MDGTLTVDELKAQIGCEVGASRWFEVSQERINAFADLTEDWQPIHIDPEAGAASPFGTTIAHGFLTMSLLSAMIYEIPSLKNVAMGVNYGFDKLRFVSPVPAGSKVRGRFKLMNLTQRSDGAYQTDYEVTVEIEGSAKPALVARWLGLRYLKEAI